MRRLLTICLGGNYTSVRTNLCARFHHVFTRLVSLEIIHFYSSSLGQTPFDPSLSTSSTEIAAFRAKLAFTRSDLKIYIIKSLSKVFFIGGDRFEYCGQIILWVHAFLPSGKCTIFFPSFDSRLSTRVISYFVW